MGKAKHLIKKNKDTKGRNISCKDGNNKGQKLKHPREAGEI